MLLFGCTHVLTLCITTSCAPGWPKPLEVVPARVGPLRASIKGDALYGTIAGRDYTLTLTTADQFGNPRCGQPLLLSCSVCCGSFSFDMSGEIAEGL